MIWFLTGFLVVFFWVCLYPKVLCFDSEKIEATSPLRVEFTRKCVNIVLEGD